MTKVSASKERVELIITCYDCTNAEKGKDCVPDFLLSWVIPVPEFVFIFTQTYCIPRIVLV